MDLSHLQLALSHAKKGKGTTFPNPAVGAVLADGPRVLATAHHERPGGLHAEAGLLANTDSVPASATLYVTLEPCAHTGRTGPCTEAILAKRVKRVVFAHADTNPSVTGMGASVLRAQGVEVEHRPIADITEFYRSYDFWLQHRRPYFTAKIATTLNARISGPLGERRHFSTPELDQFTHAWRAKHCAILTTAATVIADDPLLTVRESALPTWRPVWVLDRRLATPLNAQIWRTGAPLTFVHGSGVAEERLKAFLAQGAQLIEIATGPDQRLALPGLTHALRDAQLHDLWIEVGGTLLQQLLLEGRLDRLFWYRCPHWETPGGKLAMPGDSIWEQIGEPKRRTEKSFGSASICEMVWA